MGAAVCVLDRRRVTDAVNAITRATGGCLKFVYGRGRGNYVNVINRGSVSGIKTAFDWLCYCVVRYCTLLHITRCFILDVVSVTPPSECQVVNKAYLWEVAVGVRALFSTNFCTPLDFGTNRVDATVAITLQFIGTGF